MDVLRGNELDRYRQTALHLGRRPQIIASASGEPLFEAIDDLNDRTIDSFESNRRKLRRSSAATGGGDVFAAIPRFYSPVEYFQAQKIPYRIDREEERFKLYQWLDMFYRTHYLVPILIDIFTRFPLVGIEFDSPDKQLNTFYEELFMDRLDYEHFLVDLGREYWTLGQAFPLGHFSETLGVWEEEELIDPTMVKIREYPIIGGKQFFFSADGMEPLRHIVEKREPAEIYFLLERDYPEWIPFLKNRKDIPVSDVLLKQVAFKASTRDLHGTPILLRALRTLMHEEKLMASQDAIAERLYSPMILAKLGLEDMGQGRGPWLPGPGEIRDMRDQLDVALSSDFRLMVHHIGIDVQNVFGREQMPRLDQDFDRIERRLMQTFGVNPSLLSGGNASQPYASSALQAEFLSQILRTYQGYLIKHYKNRAALVAEAQEHYAYERRGETRIPIMEEVLTIDDETGEEVIVERHKLMIPEMRMKVLDLRDEATQRQFVQALKQQGVPIPDQDLAMGMHYVFEDALARSEDETVQKTVSQQEAKVKTYDILTAKGLPIPPDLKAEIEGMAGFQAPQQPGGPGMGGPMPGGGGDELVMPPSPDGGPDLGGGGAPPIDPNDPTRGTRPEVSDERSPIRPPSQMPQIPGVPGQPGLLGIPGAPKPAVGLSSAKLPRKKNKKASVPKLTDDLGDAIVEDTDGEA